jgi:hypothetical protein
MMQGVKREAQRHKIKLLILHTNDAIKVLKREPKDTNAILHVTCKTYRERWRRSCCIDARYGTGVKW